MRFYNYWTIHEEALNDDEIILLTYAAMYSGEVVSKRWTALLSRLNIKIWRTELQEAYFPEEHYKLVSRYPQYEAVSFVNPEVFNWSISAKARADYIRLASRVSNEQRWNFRLFKKPIHIPDVYTVPYDIPNDWVSKTNKQIHMRLEEQFYGSN